MSSTLKTTLIAGTIALSVGLFATQAAYAGGRHHIPFGPWHGYVPTSHDDYDYDECDCGYDNTYVYGHSSEAEDTVTAAARIARRATGVDLDEMLDIIGE